MLYSRHDCGLMVAPIQQPKPIYKTGRHTCLCKSLGISDREW